LARKTCIYAALCNGKSTESVTQVARNCFAFVLYNGCLIIRGITLRKMMSATCSTHGIDDKFIQNCIGKPEVLDQ
jgi:hypothetical protein